METWNYLHDRVLTGQGLEAKLFYSLLALLAFWGVRRIALAVLLRGRDVQVQYRTRKLVTYITWPFAFLVIGRIWFAGFQAVSTYLGLLSAGLAIALQSPLVNLAGWAFILWRQPFKVGDRIEIARPAGGRHRPADLHVQPDGDRQLGRRRPEHRAGPPHPQRQGFHRGAGQLRPGLPVHLERGPGAADFRKRLAPGQGAAAPGGGEALHLDQRRRPAAAARGGQEVHDLLQEPDADGLHQRPRQRGAA